MVIFELKEIILTKIFMERHAMVTSVGILMTLSLIWKYLQEWSYDSIKLNLEIECVEKFYNNTFLPSQDDPFRSFGCHIALSISDKIPMSVNNDLDYFYENMKDGKYIKNKHALYLFLFTHLTSEEYRQFLRKDLKLDQSFKHKPNYSFLTNTEEQNKLKPYIYYLCQRQTVTLKPSDVRASWAIFTLQILKKLKKYFKKKTNLTSHTIRNNLCYSRL